MGSSRLFRLYVAYEFSADLTQFRSVRGRKSGADAVLNDIFVRFRQVLEVVKDELESLREFPAHRQVSSRREVGHALHGSAHILLFAVRLREGLPGGP